MHAPASRSLVVQVTCIGPNGLAAQLQALQSLVRWSVPKVTVSEFPDMDDGTPVYEDDAIVVFAITKPSTPWNKPHFASKEQHSAGCATGISADRAVEKDKQAGSSATASRSESSSEEDTSETEDSEVDATEENHSKVAEGDLQGSGEATSDSEEESSSDSDGDTKGACIQNLEQLQLFQRMDAVLLGGGTAKEVVSNLRSCISENRVQNGIPQRTAASAQPLTASELSGGKRALLNEQPALSQTPRRVRSRVNAVHANHKIPAFSNSDKGGVVVARHATGSIAKQASGASGFLVQVKGSERCLLMSFAADVRNSHDCAVCALLVTTLHQST